MLRACLEHMRFRPRHGPPSSGRSWYAESGDDGSFVFTSVEPGLYQLHASQPGWPEIISKEGIRVEEASIEGLEIRLAKGGALTGRLLGVTGTELGDVEVNAFGTDGWEVDAGVQVSRGGIYRIFPVAPGTWNVSARLGNTDRYASHGMGSK